MLLAFSTAASIFFAFRIIPSFRIRRRRSRAVQHQPLEEGVVVFDGEAVFAIVIRTMQRVTAGDEAVAHRAILSATIPP